jgi:uncharacterized protein YdeI (YjbR/CyaY-like superfamily)
MKIKYFKTPAHFRDWLEKNHASNERELWVGYYKKDTGRASITWKESVDQALCFGWIDGVRRAVDEQSYAIRFTPRRPTSIWSEINTRRVRELIESGDMRPAGLAAFEARRDKQSDGYSIAKLKVDLDPKYTRLLRKNTKAWRFYQAQPPGYRKMVNWWVVRAKQEATRLSRLETLIAHSEKGERVPRFIPRRKKP